MSQYPQGGQYPPQGGQYPPQGQPGQYPPGGMGQPGMMGGQPGMMGGQPGMMGGGMMGQPGMMGGQPGMMGGGMMGQPGMMGGMGAQGMMGQGMGGQGYGGKKDKKGDKKAAKSFKKDMKKPQRYDMNSQYHQQNWYAQYYNMISPQEMQGLQQWFTGVDRDHSGAIDAQELGQATFSHGRSFDQQTVRKLIKVFDADYSGTISFYEFAALHKFISQLQMAFQTCDRDKSWTLDPTELHLALAQAGFQIDQEMAQPLLYRYSRAGHVSFDAFVALAVQLASIRHIFQKFSGGGPMVQMNYQQFTKVMCQAME